MNVNPPEPAERDEMAVTRGADQNGPMHDRHERPVRIANCSGFFGDRMSALADVAAEPDIDVISGDYLAEVTMLVLAKRRARNPDEGYARSFLAQFAPAVPTIAERGIKVVTNAGGLNPVGMADAIRKLLAEAGHPLKVAVVRGDDISDRLDDLGRGGHPLNHLRTGRPLSSWGHEPLTANAYLGGWGIATALGAGADIVVTGRVTDASVVVGPAAWWHGWQRDDYDRLAGAVVAGHLIECGAQVTGGNYSGFTSLAVRGKPGFPIAEIDADGSFVVSKVTGSGGALTVGTATAQLMYEIGSPLYLNPDATAHFDTVELDEDGDDRVRGHATKGTAPSPTTKVAVTAMGGFRNHATTIVTGLDADAKIAWFQEQLQESLDRNGGIESISFARIGTVADDPSTQGAGSTILRTTVTGDEQHVGRPFGAAVTELALSNFPGFYGLTLPGPASAFGTYWPGLIDQAALDHTVELPDGSTVTIDPPADTASLLPVVAPSADSTAPGSRAVLTGGDVGPLGTVCDARSGDKGGDANVGIWVRDRAHWEWLRSTLTVERFRELIPETADLDIDRYEFANVAGINFVVHDLLGEGATANVRVDTQAKALGEYLRARHVTLPS